MPTSRNAHPISQNFLACHSWWLAARPKTLVASFVPVLVASALAWRVGAFSSSTALLCLACSLCLQLATNFINDASDFERGADTSERLGPTRMAQSGALSARALYVGAGLTLGAAFLLGLFLVAIGGAWFLTLGLVSILAAIAYTAGPFPLAYYGLGDLFVFLFFGLVAIGGGYYLQTNQLDPASIAVACAVGLLATSIIAVNNVRDISTDSVAQKRTLAVRLGRQKANIYFCALLFLPYGIVLGLCLLKMLPWLSLAAWAALPLSLKLAEKIFSAGNAPEFNLLLEGSVKHQFVFSLALALGVACG